VNSSTIGAALGSIMAIIMTNHIRKTASARAGDQGAGEAEATPAWLMAVISNAFMPMPTPASV
jgi:hypothetical protein